MALTIAYLGKRGPGGFGPTGLLNKGAQTVTVATHPSHYLIAFCNSPPPDSQSSLRLLDRQVTEAVPMAIILVPPAPRSTLMHFAGVFNPALRDFRDMHQPRSAVDVRVNAPSR